MKHLEKLKEMLMTELEMFAKKGDVSINSLEKIHKLTDTIKNIDKICLLEEGYSETGEWVDHGSSYAKKRDSLGRYSSDEYSERRMRGYSRDDAKDHIMHKLGEMMEDADPKEREALKECMRAIERA